MRPTRAASQVNSCYPMKTKGKKTKEKKKKLTAFSETFESANSKAESRLPVLGRSWAWPTRCTRPKIDDTTTCEVPHREIQQAAPMQGFADPDNPEHQLPALPKYCRGRGEGVAAGRGEGTIGR